MAQSAQWAQVYRIGSTYPGEIVHAHYVEHRFARHAHEHLVIALVERGIQQYTYLGSVYRTPPGQIFFVDGGEPQSPLLDIKGTHPVHSQKRTLMPSTKTFKIRKLNLL